MAGRKMAGRKMAGRKMAGRNDPNQGALGKPSATSSRWLCNGWVGRDGHEGTLLRPGVRARPSGAVVLRVTSGCYPR
jgi:hypothetical protein